MMPANDLITSDKEDCTTLFQPKYFHKWRELLPSRSTRPADIAASSNSPDTIGRRPGVPAKKQGIGSPTVEWLLSRANAWRPCLGKPRVMIRAVALLHRVVLYANKDEVISNETSL